MSADSILDEAFTRLLGLIHDAVDSAPPISVRPGVINITFSGGGSALPATGLPGIVEVPFPADIVWAHIYAGDETGAALACTVAIDLRLTDRPAFGAGGSLALYGATMPGLTAQSSADVDITNWTTSLITGDAILFRLDSFTGTATWITLSLLIRPTEVPLTGALVDNSGNPIVDNAGDPVFSRV